MRRIILVPAVALLLSAILLPASAGYPVDAAAARTTWTARLATNGTATISLPSSGPGTLALQLRGMSPGTTYPVVLLRGSCAPIPYPKLLTLPSQRPTASGKVSRTFSLTAAQARSVRQAYPSGLIVRLGALCARFIVPLAPLTLERGDGRFSLGGRERLLFARNLTAYWQTDFNEVLALARAGGSRLVRVQLELGFGDHNVMTSTGAVDETWARKWEQVLDQANSEGLYVIVMLAGWCDWNDGDPDLVGHRWDRNPLNVANGGSAKSPEELFQAGSRTQKLWLAWARSLVSRWANRTNIAAWELFSEVNLASRVTEQSGVAFVDAAAAAIRSADPLHRPITASIATFPDWPSLLGDPNLDFNQVHPYPPSGMLDTALLADVRAKLAFGKPVLIGESGLSAAPPDGSTLETAPRAAIGVRHAIWAGLVSGAMDARALWWQDSVGMYFPNLGMDWVRGWAHAEVPATRFAAGVADWTGYVPLDATSSATIVGAVVGNATSAIGWYRDAACEPPDWPVAGPIHGAEVAVTAPGSAARWKIDVNDTASGTRSLASMTIERQDGRVRFVLPDFSDDVAFRMTALP